MQRLLVILVLLSGLAGAVEPVRHPLAPGQTVADLTRLYGTPVTAIRAANPELTFEEGTTVAVPPPSGGWPTHIVVKGQTLWAVSKLYGTSVEALQQANSLEGTQIVSGQTLVVPVHPDSVSTWIEVRTLDGTPAWVERRNMLMGTLSPGGPERVVDLARRFSGVPYRWGGQSPNGADCSGFVHEVFRLAGYSVPRTADKQFEEGSPAEEPAPGDLVFFSTYEPGPSHVGIYLGEGRFIHASSSNGVVETDLEEDYFKSRFLGIRRLIR